MTTILPLWIIAADSSSFGASKKSEYVGRPLKICVISRCLRADAADISEFDMSAGRSS